jgi:hypothetical protein
LLLVESNISSLFFTMLKWWLCRMFLSQYLGVSH